MDFDNLERMIIDNQKSINRLLSAIQTLKEQQDKGDKELKDSLDYLSDSKIKEILKESSEDICLYTIKEGEWYFNNKPTGIKAIGKDGQDGKDGKDGKDGLPGKDGKNGQDGKDGKDGKNGLPGKDGKNGLNGLPGKDGRNGKDVDLRIGKVETSDDKAYAKLRKEGDIVYLDLKLPKGPQGFMGFDGKDGRDGKDGTINGYNDVTIEAGDNIKITQKEDKITINGIELISGDNAIIEDNQINVFTNTGYVISDKNVKVQNIKATTSTGKEKIIYIEDKGLTFIVDGSNIIRRSKNNIDFVPEVMTRDVKDIVFLPSNSAIVLLCADDGCFMISYDYGKTWSDYYDDTVLGADYLFAYKTNASAFTVVKKATGEIKSFIIKDDLTISDNGYSIENVFDFLTKYNNTYFLSCNTFGVFKYSNQSRFYDTFPDLPGGVIVNALVSPNNLAVACLKDSNKIYRLNQNTTIGTSRWLEYELPAVCTVNDVIFYDDTYYILTNINSYYKTKDFTIYESVDTGVRGLQGCITLMGLQAVTEKNGELMLAPTRTRLEDKAQEWDRAVDKERWVGGGLKLDSDTGVVSVKTMFPLRVSPTGTLQLQQLSMEYLPSELTKTIMLANATIHTNPIAEYGDIESWFWEMCYPSEGYVSINKVIFDEAITFLDFARYETEYTVEKYEYGYIYYNEVDGYFCEYVKLGNFSSLIKEE